MNPLFGLLGRDIATRLSSGDLMVTDFYNRLYITIALITLAILGISFASDVAGHNWVNIVIIPIGVLAVMWVKFYPRAIAGAIVVTAASTGLVTSIKDGYEKWDIFTKQAALFVGVFGLTRFLVPIKAFPFMGMLLLGALITLGFYAWVWPTGKAYKRYVLGIVLVAIAIGLFGTVTGKSTSGGLPGLASEFSGATKTLEIEVSSLQPHQLCGVRPGERKFTVPQKSFVRIDGDDYEINTYVRVNGSLPNESFTVDGSGCTTVSFAFTKKALGRAIDPQILQIALK